MQVYIGYNCVCKNCMCQQYRTSIYWDFGAEQLRLYVTFYYASLVSYQ